jgi:hypothetical protein
MAMSELQWDEVEIPKPKKSGKGVANPNIQWPLAEKLYVEGELVGEAEHTRRVYPSLKDIAQRVGTSKSNLNQRSWRYNWSDKRRSFQAENAIVPAFTQGNKLPAVDFVPRKLAKRDPESVLRAYIDLFAEAVEKRTVRYDTIADLDKAIRLLAFVRGQAESTKHVHVSVSLEAMQARHRELRQLVASRVDDDVAGVLGCGEPMVALSGVEEGEVDDPDAWDAPSPSSAYAAE